jgi:uncharacterized membrane protein
MATAIEAMEPGTAPAPPRSAQERVSDVITSFCGDMKFVYVHVVLFAIWIGTSGFGNDSFPYNFLTMAVSLEAIFLSTFILISQNRQQAMAEAHNEQIQARLLQMLHDVVTDEKMDLRNEEMISKVLERLDVERISPIIDHVQAISACVGRIEARLDMPASGA